MPVRVPRVRITRLADCRRPPDLGRPSGTGPVGGCAGGARRKCAGYQCRHCARRPALERTDSADWHSAKSITEPPSGVRRDWAIVLLFNLHAMETWPRRAFRVSHAPPQDGTGIGMKDLLRRQQGLPGHSCMQHVGAVPGTAREPGSPLPGTPASLDFTRYAWYLSRRSFSPPVAIPA